MKSEEMQSAENLIAAIPPIVRSGIRRNWLNEFHSLGKQLDYEQKKAEKEGKEVAPDTHLKITKKKYYILLCLATIGMQLVESREDLIKLITDE